MEVGDSLRNLADVVDEIEGTSAEVVEATPNGFETGEFVADIRVRIPADPSAEIGSSQSATDSGLATDEDAADRDTDETTTPDDSSIRDRRGDEPTDVTTEGNAGTKDGASISGSASSDSPENDDAATEGSAPVVCNVEGCDADFDSEHGMRIHRTKTHGPAGPDYDREVLREVYDSHDSFGDMREALGVEVSAQSVRRWMMDRGIHDPGNSSPADEGTSDGDPTDEETAGGKPAAGTNGTEPSAVPEDASADRTRLPAVDDSLPEGVTATTLREAVEGADTLYDVQTDLDVDRGTARDLLSEYDLLELVHGRVADRRRREELKEEIDDRLKANAPTANSSSD